MSRKDTQNPKDLAEAITVIDALATDEEREEFKKKTKFVALGFGFGSGMIFRNRFQLWDENSNLHKYFKSLGIWHPDDMSGIIFESYHRYLNGKPIELDKQIQCYKDYWEQSDQDGMEMNVDGSKVTVHTIKVPYNK